MSDTGLSCRGWRKGVIRRRGRGWEATIECPQHPRQRCAACGAAFWVEDGQRARQACSCGHQLASSNELRTRSRGGFPTRKAAEQAQGRWLYGDAEAAQEVLADAGRTTYGRYLERWLGTLAEDEVPLASSTLAGYESQIRRHILPTLGSVRLSDLRGPHLAELYAHLTRDGKVGGGSLSRASVAKIRAINHAALADAVAFGLLPRNPADQLGRRGRHRSGDRRVEHQDEMRVQAWSPEQLQTFLASARKTAEEDIQARLAPRDKRRPVTGIALYPLWATIAGTGLRRQEALGLKWDAVDLEAKTLMVRLTRTPVKGDIIEGPPKTRCSRRTVSLPASVVAVLRGWRRAQKEAQLRAGSAWQDTGFVFTYEDGRPLCPRWVSRLFRAAIERCQAQGGELPMLSVHGLRHSFATAALLARVDIKTVSVMLGHANTQITLDTYQHVLEGMRSDAAEQIAGTLFGASAVAGH